MSALLAERGRETSGSLSDEKSRGVLSSRLFLTAEEPLIRTDTLPSHFSSNNAIDLMADGYQL